MISIFFERPKTRKIIFRAPRDTRYVRRMRMRPPAPTQPWPVDEDLETLDARLGGTGPRAAGDTTGRNASTFGGGRKPFSPMGPQRVHSGCPGSPTGARRDEKNGWPPSLYSYFMKACAVTWGGFSSVSRGGNAQGSKSAGGVGGPPLPVQKGWGTPPPPSVTWSR